MLAEDAAKYAYFRTDSTEPRDDSLLRRIEGSAGMTLRELVASTGMEKDAVRESLQRLDKSLKLLHAYSDREDWSSENTYVVYNPDIPSKNPEDELVERIVRAYGPIPATSIRFIINLSDEEIMSVLGRIGATQILVGPGQVPMYVMPDEISGLDESYAVPSDVRILSLYDPDMGSKWAEIASRYGDKWIYPVVQGTRVIGAMEIWEMSGCVEVRSIDLDSPDMLSSAMDALDAFMKYFGQKGIDIVRVREVLSTDVSQVDDSVKDIFTKHGYRFINGFYAKGQFIMRVMTQDEMLSYIFHKQHLEKMSRFPTADDLIRYRGYIRSDQELPARTTLKTSLKKQMELGNLVKGMLCPTYVGYADLSRMSVYAAAKKIPLTGEQVAIKKIIEKHQPISKKDLTPLSPYSANVTNETLSGLMKLSQIYQDVDSNYAVTPKSELSVEAALKEIARWHFKDLGIFTAEHLGQFLGCRMSLTRKILASLEDEGFLSKGFILEGSPIPYWMLSEDVDTRVRPFTGMFLLNTQDNLSLYLRDIIKKECGGTVSVIFSGTKIIGHFKGKLTPTSAKVEEFEGSDMARKYLEDLAHLYGIQLIEGREPVDDDWEASEFYSKVNPGL